MDDGCKPSVSRSIRCFFQIDIKDLALSVGGRDLLSRANLTLREDKHYVLVGRNGTGKSTLIRALAEGRIPGVPWSLHMLLLGQTDFVNSNILDESLAAMQVEDITVLEHVMRSEARRERALAEAKCTHPWLLILPSYNA